MNAILLAVALTQATGFTPFQESALQQAFADTVAWVRAGNAPIHSRATEVHGGTPLTEAGVAVRCTGYFTEADMAFWTFDPSVYNVTAGEPPQASSPSWLRYAVVTVAVSGTRADPPAYTWGLEALPGTCSGPLPAPVGSWPVVITTFNDPASQVTTTGWSAGCRTGPACTYTQRLIDGTTQEVPCPKALTMSPGTFSGADVLLKTAVEWAGANSLPDACR